MKFPNILDAVRRRRESRRLDREILGFIEREVQKGVEARLRERRAAPLSKEGQEIVRSWREIEPQVEDFILKVQEKSDMINRRGETLSDNAKRMKIVLRRHARNLMPYAGALAAPLDQAGIFDATMEEINRLAAFRKLIEPQVQKIKRNIWNLPFEYTGKMNPQIQKIDDAIQVYDKTALQSLMIGLDFIVIGATGSKLPPLHSKNPLQRIIPAARKILGV